MTALAIGNASSLPLPTDWAELVQAYDHRDVVPATPDDFPVIDIHAL